MRRGATMFRYFMAAFVCATIYCEWIVYMVQPNYWPELKCADEDSSCVKVLFVADPQIQGDDAVPPPFSYVINWDSDKYLKSTFHVVMRYFKPNVIVYMGDLMDEGSTSTVSQFYSYVSRLSSIFELAYNTMQVWIPGDNDIGGENEPIKKNKVKMFSETFKQPDVVTYRNVSFYKVNAITHDIPKDTRNDNFKIVISHYPVTENPYFGQMVNNAINPNIYFCAHNHESKYVKQSKSLTFREYTPFVTRDSILEAFFSVDNDELYEIYVPTCSYRMGTSNIGFGAAVFGPEKADVLPLFHAFSGCDTVSAFAGKGKKALSKLGPLIPLPRKVSNMQKKEILIEQALPILERFVIAMYDRSCACTQVNQSRKYLFTKKDRQLENLPPTQDALRNHILRAIYQGGHIWGQLLIPMQDRPCPGDWGWAKNNGIWEPVWTTLPPAAAVCMELIRCRCKQKCAGRCNCLKREIRCTELCGCSGNC